MKVIAKVQAPHNPETEIVWVTDGDETDAMISVGQIFKHARDDAPWNPKFLEIRIEL